MYRSSDSLGPSSPVPAYETVKVTLQKNNTYGLLLSESQSPSSISFTSPSHNPPPGSLASDLQDGESRHPPMRLDGGKVTLQENSSHSLRTSDSQSSPLTSPTHNLPPGSSASDSQPPHSSPLPVSTSSVSPGGGTAIQYTNTHMRF